MKRGPAAGAFANCANAQGWNSVSIRVDGLGGNETELTVSAVFYGIIAAIAKTVDSDISQYSKRQFSGIVWGGKKGWEQTRKFHRILAT